MPEGLQTFVLAVAVLGTALAPVLLSLAAFVSLLMTPGIGAGIVTFFTWLLPFLGPVGLIAAGVAAVVAAFVYWDDITAIVGRVYTAIKTYLVDKLSWVIDQVTGLVGKVVAAFQWAADTIALHSLVPDMVGVIADEFGRLDRVMVDPANAAAAEVMRAFNGITSPTLATGALSAAGRGGAADGPTITINMTGMVGADDPQTRAMLRQAVSDALMPGMRTARLMGTA